MADDNSVYTHQAGEIVTKTFDIKSVTLADAQQMEITGVYELPYSDKVEYAPWEGSNGNRIAMFQGKVIITNFGGVPKAVYDTEQNVEEAIDYGITFSQIGASNQTPISTLRKMGAPISEAETILYTNVPGSTLLQLVDIPIFSTSN